MSPAGPALAAELAAALARRARRPGAPALVAPPGHALAGAVAGAGGAVVDVRGPQAAAGVAAGLALAGRPAVAVLAAGVPAPLPATVPGLVGVTADARVAGGCWGAGWTLVQPAWPGDLDALLDGALAAGAPVVLLVAERDTDVPAGVGAPAEPARFGHPRLLRDGAGGLLVACGAARTVLLAQVARMLAGRGVPVAAAEFHTLRPGEGPGPLAAGRALFVADGRGADHLRSDGGWPGDLVAVEVPDEPRAAMEAVGARLRARA